MVRALGDVDGAEALEKEVLPETVDRRCDTWQWSNAVINRHAMCRRCGARIAVDGVRISRSAELKGQVGAAQVGNGDDNDPSLSRQRETAIRGEKQGMRGIGQVAARDSGEENDGATTQLQRAVAGDERRNS